MQGWPGLRKALSALFAAAWVAFFAFSFFGFPAAGYDGPRFPDPVLDQAVYDQANAIDRSLIPALEAQIDAIEARSGAEVAIYLRVDPGATEDSNLAAARALMDQWGVGREGFDDGLVILVGLQPDLIHGKVSLYAGSGFLGAYLSQGDIQNVIDEVIVPAARQQQLGPGLILAMQAIDAAVTRSATDRLNFLRAVNGFLGLVGAPVAFIVAVWVAVRAWRRSGRDPRVLDSPSILMAGPPAGMTPPLATVMRSGRATQHSINTLLVELASNGLIAFQNLDQVSSAKRDDEPNPLLDPAIEVHVSASPAGRLGRAERQAWDLLRRESFGDGVLSRERLWRLEDTLDPLRGALEAEAVGLGWMTHVSGPIIARWSAIGIGELILGALAVLVGFVIPISGATLLGVGIGLGGVATFGLGQAMSQRTPTGGYVDAMLKAYRRTLEKTLAQARNLEQVVADETVKMLADTPDKAVVWGFALGLHAAVAEVLRRSFEDSSQRADGAIPYYPIWLGGSSNFSGGGGLGAGAAVAGGGFFSGSGVPDIGGMFSAIGSVGSAPPSSSGSGGGGFGGGDGGGGGGGSGSF